jgi:hypothetical protein
MPIMLSQCWRQTATERRPFATFTGMRVDGLAAQDQRAGGGAAVLMLSESRLSASRLRDCEAAVSLAAPQPQPCPPAGSTPPADARLH